MINNLFPYNSQKDRTFDQIWDNGLGKIEGNKEAISVIKYPPNLFGL